MIVSTLVSNCAKNVVHLSGRFQGQMGGYICGVASRGPSSSCCFHLYSGKSKRNYAGPCISRTISCTSASGFQSFQGNCFGSCFSKPGRNLHSLTIKSFISARGYQKRQVKISLTCQSMKMRLLVPTQGVLTKTKCNAGPIHWPQGCASVGLIFGLVVCYSSSKPVHAEAADEKEDKDCDLSYVKYSHGKKVYTDYSVIGIPGDGRCLFRSVAHGACLRAGKPAPSGSLQRELADDLRTRVADEFIKRREETEWFVEGDFDTYVSHIRKPHVWGGEPELFMASHVLQTPITVYMYDKDAGGLIPIAEYGQEYGKENPIRVLYHGFGHYDALHIPGNKEGRSKL
ncbi:OTU domain-containing protein [Melia azedarach]|uniref:OTU domain-containing protein n=1 Tax=Melia azedarach TaxID=155640 RepID=A0ACC1X4U4_MELAZ|nr:OTU domain-containing protein [Melia azedarach]